MAQPIDTLEIVFSANILPLSACLSQINFQLYSVRSAADIADASLRGMASSLDFGMAALKKDANSAGAAVGTAFAQGLRAKRGAVDSAVRYLTSAALEALRRLLAMGGGSGAAAQSLGAASVERFDAASMAAAAPSGEERALNITVPLNVDGVKLGEACVRGLRDAASLTGRSVISI